MAFITLTARGGKGRTPERSMQAFKEGWPKLRLRAKYHMGKFFYLLIPEQHKDGNMHTHMIATNTEKEKFWKDNAASTGLGWKADVKSMYSAGGVPAYISKYMGKAVHLQCWPKGFRRVRVSQNWPKLPDIEDPRELEYTVYRNIDILEKRLDGLLDLGFEITLACELVY